MFIIPANTEAQIIELKRQCETIKPLVVISCITYNHEPYIRDALDGFVMQQTDFPFVAIVHDDASTDGTTAIIHEYAEKYPDIIKPIFETENQYSKKDGTLTHIMNEARISSGAKYVAYCEGDDYWTDPLKLQKQVSFLESNPEYSMCFHNATKLYSNSNRMTKFSNLNSDRDLTYKQGVEKWLIPTASIVLRTHVQTSTKYKIAQIYSGDYRLIQLCLLYGKIRYLNFAGSIYRINYNNNSATSVYRDKYIFIVEQHILVLNSVLPYANTEYKKTIKTAIHKYKREIKFQEAKGHYNILKIICFADVILNKILRRIKLLFGYVDESC